MIRIVLAFVAVLAVSAAPVFAQCNAANGQCGAPNANSSVNAQAIQAALNAGLATSAASSAVAPAPVAPAPQIVYQAAAPAFTYAGVVNPNAVLLQLPAPVAVSPAPADVAAQAASVPAIFQLAAFQAPAASGSAAASASASAPAFAAVPVNPGLAASSIQSSSACASGNCSARSGGLLRRLVGRRSSSRSVSISRSRVR